MSSANPSLDILVTSEGQVIHETYFRGLSFDEKFGGEKSWFAIMGWDGGWVEVALQEHEADQVREWAKDRAMQRTNDRVKWEEFLSAQKKKSGDVE